MSVALVRKGLRAWISSRTRIDAWDLDVPSNVPTVLDTGAVRRRYPANCAMELPITNLLLQKSANQVEGQALFTYLILFRFSGKAAKEQLPTGDVENLVNWLGQEAVYWPGEIWAGVRQLTAQADEPVVLARVEGEDSDWLLIARLEFEIRFISQAVAPEVVQPPPLADPGITLNRVNINVNRSDIPVTPSVPETYTLDRQLQKP